MTTDLRTLSFDNQSDANMRAWGSGINAAMAAVGLIQTGNTGQINWTTVTRPALTGGTSGEVVIGYEVWRLNDTLQSTVPLYIKIEYGIYYQYNSNNSTQLYQGCSMWITVGTTTDGAATVAGYATARTRIGGGPSSTQSLSTGTVITPSTSLPVATCGHASSLIMVIGATTGAQPKYAVPGASSTMYGSTPYIFGIERTRDPVTGTASADGYILFTNYWNQPGVQNTVPSGITPAFQLVQLPNATSGVSGSIGTADSSWPIAWPGNAISTAATASVVNFFPMTVATQALASQSLLVLGTYKADMAFGTTITVNMMGSTHTFMSVANMGGATANDQTRSQVSNIVTNGAILMRWE